MLTVDWGGTWCRAALVDRDGQILWGNRRTNPSGGTTAEYLALADGLLSEALAVEGIRPGGIGVAVAGPVDPESGILYQPPNLMALDGVSLKQVWGERFGLPVVLGNDANLAAVGEYHYGAGRDALRAGHPLKSLFYVTISTGIGGGVVENGSLILGANGSPPRWATPRSIPPGTRLCASAARGVAWRPSRQAPPSPTLPDRHWPRVGTRTHP